MPNTTRLLNIILIAGAAIISSKAAVLFLYGHPERSLKGFAIAAVFLMFVVTNEKLGK